MEKKNYLDYECEEPDFLNSPTVQQIEELCIDNSSMGGMMQENQFSQRSEAVASDLDWLIDSTVNDQALQSANHAEQFNYSQKSSQQEKVCKETHKYRIREKISKAKERFPEKEKLIKKEAMNPRLQKRLLRNRISAQKSRDKQKDEIIRLQEENERLRASNAELGRELSKANSKLNMVHKAIKQLPEESRTELIRIQESLELAVDDSEVLTEGPSNTRLRCTVPLFLAGAFILCVCLVSCLSPFVTFNHMQNTVESDDNSGYCPIRDIFGKLQQCKRAFIDNNWDLMRNYDDSLDTYQEAGHTQCPSNDRKGVDVASLIDNKVDTMYIPKAYIMTDLDINIDNLMKCNGNFDNYKSLHMIIPEKSIVFVLPNGTAKSNCMNSNKTLEIGCKVFNLDRIDPILPTYIIE